MWRSVFNCSNIANRCYYAGNVMSVCTFSRCQYEINKSSSELLSNFVSRNSCLFIKRNLCTKRPYEVNTNVQKDVLLYRYLNPNWYRVLNAFAICQFGFWMYSSHLGYIFLKDTPVNYDSDKDVAFWRKINFGEKKFRLTFTAITAFIGLFLLAATCLYTARSVKYLMLLKGGKNITLTTHGPFGRSITKTVPLADVSCPTSRTSAKVQLPLKVKGKYLYYVLDMKGEFTNPLLFDYTAGLQRKF